MKISRWMSEIPATKNLVTTLYTMENLEAQDVSIIGGKKMSGIRSQMTEIIQLYQGELIFNLSGTQFVLRAGDRLQMSGNTLYSLSNMKEETAAFFIARTI